MINIVIVIIFLFVMLFITKKINSTNSGIIYQQIIPNNINNRSEIGLFLDKQKFKSGIEVGVKRGGYADSLISKWSYCRKYIMIDPWLKQNFYDDYANVPNTEQNRIFNMAMNVVNKYSNRVEFIILRTTSENAIPYLKGNFYDYIYLDARHDYISVKNDINMYFALLKPGGIIAGHDYLDSTKVAGNEWLLDSKGKKNSDFKAVKSAVDEFAYKYKLNITLTNEKNKSWMIRKPK